MTFEDWVTQRSWSAGGVHRSCSGLPCRKAAAHEHRHITWFRDSNPIGTVTDARAQLGVQLVPPLS